MHVFWLISVLFLWIQGIQLGQSEISCGTPPVIEKTIVSPIGITEYPIGTILKYSCDFGYLSHQALPTTKCVAGEDPDTAVWTKISLNCIPRSCGDPGGVANHAKMEGSVFSYPNSVTYVCDEGYKIRGSSKRFCQTNGEWSGNAPTCIEITCDVPENPEHGRAKYDSLEYGAKLNYECSKGFRPDVTDERICESDGEWSGTTPACIEMQCKYPDSPDNGSIDLPGGIPKVDSIVFYKCNDGLKLVGSLRAKCLSSGDWTFPTPICVEPCIVPVISNGAIIKYSGYRYRTIEVIPEGTEIEDVKQIYLKCDRNFEPLGRREREISISCTDGKWSTEPKCFEASCRINPPTVLHATLTTREIHHGVTLTYTCNRNFYKAEYGKVTCERGTWNGKIPVCKDSRCYITSATFPGVISKQRGQYWNGAVIKAQCDSGYQLSDIGNGEMRCLDGKWSGAVSPCIGAPCTDPPPSLKNGHTESFSGLHGTSVKYTCNYYFTLKNPSDPITCKLGEWIGQIPECKDSRCYLDDLPNKEGLDLSHSGPALSGDLAEIHCVEGYNMKYSKPKCSEGVWSQQNKYSPCQKSNCAVTVLQNGEFVFPVTTSYWAILKARRVYKTTYKVARVPSAQRPGSELFVRCKWPYIFNGNDYTQHVSVTCDKGQWNPLPHCLKHGQRPPPVPDRQPHSATTEGTVFAILTARTSTTVPTNAPQTSQKDIDNLNLPTTVGSLDNEDAKDCFCTFNAFDENLMAYSGNKQLEYGGKVKENYTIEFHCKIFGFHRLRGAPELTCQNCSWHSSEFPSCVAPSVGDPIIIVDSKDYNSFTFTQSGSLVIPSNVDVNITCHLYYLDDWTSIKGPQKNMKLEHAYFLMDGKQVFTTYLQINEIKPSATGAYVCTRVGKENALQVEIVVGGGKCPIIEETDDLDVGYGVEEFHQVAIFYCRNKNKVLIGPNKITCLSNGRWSAGIPKCKTVIQCPELKETEGLTITYTNHRQMNSSAAFHCAEPYRRRGVAYVTCLANGEWSESSVNCTLPTCTVDSVFKIIPTTVTVDLNNVSEDVLPHGTSLDIVCLGDNHHIVGDRTVICTEIGSWSVGDIRCVFGCDPVMKSNNSTLIIKPQKEVYKFGDDAVFSCPPGQELTSDVQRVLCLQDGWSDAFPDCRDAKI